MAFFCLSSKTGTIIVGVLNLIIGLAIVIEYMLGGLNYMRSFSETVTRLSGGNETDFDYDSATPAHPFTLSASKVMTTTTTLSSLILTGESLEEEECGFGCSFMANIQILCFWIGSIWILVTCLGSGVTALISVFDIKSRKHFLRASMLFTAAFLGGTFGQCLIMFILGVHWLDLLPLFVWGCLLQFYFCVVLNEYIKSIEFQQVPQTSGNA